MNRRQFFLQIGNDLTQTIQDLVFDYLHEKKETMNALVDELIDLKWIPIGKFHPATFDMIQEFYIKGKPVYVYSDGKIMKAVGGICTACQSITIWIAHEKKIKCTQCEGSYSIEQEEGTLPLESYPTKVDDDVWYVAAV
ncbi:hypothetical protein L1765_01845 [Microaerobacter geothermalis]|uniref:hypothetical protein n=1 Tax=Microaerobacter geothermalis TaxID=674972 RepID=UPI001F42B620|nr:hypothetical protein [Microaerobacter geothermalis]MCF6092736.1 hypothetical protein [Microaerobacter geothermalis]